VSEYQQKDNSGALFRNKKESDSHPDYKGSAMIDGTEYWFSAWINESKTGTKYMKTSFSPKEQVHNNGVQQVQAAVGGMSIAEMDEDIPF
tara:strand:- start:56 stop:325 length:270 start_codon:yes stop_codon:yes gene_type:complete